MATLSSPAVSDLILNVRTMLRQPDPSNSNWTDDDLIVWLNEAVRRYFQEVILHSEGQFTTQADLDIVANASSITLPGDFFQAKVLYRKVSNGYQALAYDNNITSGYSTDGGGGDAYLPAYRFQGNTLQLRPLPAFSETSALRLEYIQFPATMITGGDSMTAQVSPVFRDLIETYVVWKAKVSESLVNGVNTSALAKETLDGLYTSFREAIASRALFPTSVQPFNPESD